MIRYMDWISVLLYLCIVSAGLVNLYSFSSMGSAGFSDTSFAKQCLFFSISVFIVIVLLLIRVRFYERVARWSYILMLLLLACIFLFGKEVAGALSWYSIGKFSLQPSEFSKITTLLMLSWFVKRRQGDIRNTPDRFRGLVIVGIPMFLVLLQPDMGTALVFVGILLLLFLEGFPKIYLILGFEAVLMFILTLKFDQWGFVVAVFILIVFLLYIKGKRRRLALPAVTLMVVVSGLVSFGTKYTYDNLLKPHHQNRLKLWLNIDINPDEIYDLRRNIAYNSYQSEKAIGSGNLWGKGFRQGGLTKGGFVPKQHTDYIFTILGEEWGFIGCLLVLLLYSLLIIRLVFLAYSQRNIFSRFYGYGVAIVLFFHYSINIGMVMGLLPTVGIPLPFFSYGGSSFIAFSIMLFIFLRLQPGGLRKSD